MAGQQFAYAFDEIGNRLSTQVGGDAAGGHRRDADYDVNHRNQSERRDVPAAMDVIGAAPATSPVTVNTQSVERRGAYYRHELSTPNSSASVWQQVDVDVAPLGSVDKTGHVFVPQSPEVFVYDADGNLTQDGRWDYTWDAENRLIKLASRTGAPGGSERCLGFEYDHRGRRIGKKVWPNPTGTGPATLDERYLYEGWNLVAVIDSSSALTQFFVWGLDLSGAMQSAGGVGGLLWGRMNGPAPSFAAFDGNGNVAALVHGSSGGVDAQYEYGPFGELLRATGPLALANPFRFSTKYQDDETGLLYYGYRYYNSSTGRWLNRDPIGEKGGLNLYGFVANNPITHFDLLGQQVDKIKDRWNCRFTVRLRIQIFVDPENAQVVNLSSVASRIDSSIESHWGTWQTNGWTITFEAQVTPIGLRPPPPKGGPAQIDNSNQIEINDEPATFRSFVNWRHNRGQWTQRADDWVFAHEAGHLMGLPDDYHDTPSGSVPNAGHAGHMMGDYGGSVVWHEVLDITGPLPMCCPKTRRTR